MKIKSKAAGLILATTMVAFIVPTQAAWAHNQHCSGKGWHMVSKKCDIKPATTWQEYDSGVYTQPMTGKGMPFLR